VFLILVELTLVTSVALFFFDVLVADAVRRPHLRLYIVATSAAT